MSEQDDRAHKGPMAVICGPTASGKSGLAMELAARVGGVIISADSAQVYRGLDIGTAKPTAAEQAAVPHRLIDVVEPDGTYDAGRFVADAERAIHEAWEAGQVPLVVGGTGMWLRALLYGLVELPGRDEALREALAARVDAEGAAALHAELAQVDPPTAARVHPNDTTRVIRALEVHRLSGRPLSAFLAEHDVQHRAPRYDAVQVALGPARERLYARINARVGAMLDAGWYDEVRALLARGVSPAARGMGVMGYRHVVDQLLGRAPGVDAAAAKALIQRDHRRYAKRQFTWFRGQPRLEWYARAEDALEPVFERLR